MACEKGRAIFSVLRLAPGSGLFDFFARCERLIGPQAVQEHLFLIRPVCRVLLHPHF